MKKSEQGQSNAKLEKEKPNALEGIDLSNYASVVVIDDHPAVTDPSLCDADEGDFQEVTSKKRHKTLADGDSKKKKEVRVHVAAAACCIFVCATVMRYTICQSNELL